MDHLDQETNINNYFLQLKFEFVLILGIRIQSFSLGAYLSYPPGLHRRNKPYNTSQQVRLPGNARLHGKQAIKQSAVEENDNK